MIPTTSDGCATQMAFVPNARANSTCVDIATTSLGATDGSVIGGHGSLQNRATWQNVSWGTLHSFLLDGNGLPDSDNLGSNSTGATKLVLPFVTGTLHPYEINSAAAGRRIGQFGVGCISPRERSSNSRVVQ